MKTIRIPALTLLLAVLLLGCPKKDDGTNGEDTPTAEPTASTVATEPPEEGATTIRYHWSGGFSIFEFYTLTITDDGDSDPMVKFTMKPVKGEERNLDERLDPDDYQDLQRRLKDADFWSLEQKSRGMKIMDIGRTVLTVTQPDGKSHEVYEDPDTTTSGSLKDVRAWFDSRVREYLEQVSKPDEKKEE